MLLEYALQMNEGVQMQSPIVTKSIAATPHLINSMKILCCDPALEQYLEDDIISEIVV